MSKLVKQRSKKAGLPPGTLIHIGEKRRETTAITLFNYNEEHYKEKEISTIDECILFKDKPTVTWINVDGIHQVDILEKLGSCFGLHPLVQEDILNTDQRPKIEDYGDYIYIVVKMLYYDDKIREIITEQVSLVLGKSFVISFQEGYEKGRDVFNPIRERIRNGIGRMRKMGPDFLVYSLLDAIVDNYFTILEKLGDKIEVAEETLVAKPTPQVLKTIQYLKKEMLFLHKAIWPLREVISVLQRRESPLIKETTEVYLRDVYDHVVQLMDTSETLRDILSSMLDIYLSSTSNKMNEVMKLLTIISTVFIPLTFIAGVYGMNFKYMPELEWRWGYLAVWAVMIAIFCIMIIYFKRKKWI